MKKITSITLFYLIFVSNANSQKVNWFETIGTKITEYYQDWNFIALAGLGGDDSTVVLSGTSRNQAVFFYKSNDSLTFKERRFGLENRFIAQYNSSGKLLWNKKLGGGSIFDNATMAYSGGNTYFASVFYNNMVADGDTFRSVACSLYLVKYNQKGQREWIKFSTPFYYSEDINPRKILVDKNENIYLFGESSGYTELGFDGQYSKGNTFQFVFKFDKKGSPLSNFTFKEETKNKWNLRIPDALTDTLGNIYTLLSDGGLGVQSSCKYSQWQSKVIKITPEGVVSNLFNITSDDLMSASSFLKMPNGDFIVTGSYRGQLKINNFRTVNQSCSNTIYFLTRVTAEGKVLWFKKGEPSQFSHGFNLEMEDEFSFLATTFQTYPSPKSVPDAPVGFPQDGRRLIIKRISASGQTIDSTEFNVSGRLDDISLYHFKTKKTKSGIYLAGNYECYFDKSMESTCGSYVNEASGQKIFLLKLDKNALKNEPFKPFFDPTEISVEPNPTTGTLFYRFKNPITEPLSLQIFDVNGRLMKSQNIDGTIQYQSLFIDDFPAGMYFLNIRSETINVIKKIVKQ